MDNWTLFLFFLDKMCLRIYYYTYKPNNIYYINSN